MLYYSKHYKVLAEVLPGVMSAPAGTEVKLANTGFGRRRRGALSFLGPGVLGEPEHISGLF